MYISPSRLQLFEADPKGFYFKYLSGREIEDTSSKLPLQIGSKFDVIVKRSLGLEMGSKPGTLGQDEAQTLWDGYRGTPLDRLLVELGEFYLMEQRLYAVVNGVPFLGIPDFFRKDKLYIVDLKTSWGERTSPLPGFIWRSDTGVCHKDCLPYYSDKFRVTVNVQGCLSDVDPWWAAQLIIYSWLLGNEVGDKVIGGIDHVTRIKGMVVTSSYRYVLGRPVQEAFFNYCKDVWAKINSPEYWAKMGLGINGEEDEKIWQEYDLLGLGGWRKTDWRDKTPIKE